MTSLGARSCNAPPIHGARSRKELEPPSPRARGFSFSWGLIACRGKSTGGMKNQGYRSEGHVSATSGKKKKPGDRNEEGIAEGRFFVRPASVVDRGGRSPGNHYNLPMTRCLKANMFSHPESPFSPKQRRLQILQHKKQKPQKQKRKKEKKKQKPQPRLAYHEPVAAGGGKDR